MASDPRNNPDDAYEAFMSMPETEWKELLKSLFSGGVLTPAEAEGFNRACLHRPRLSAPSTTAADTAAGSAATMAERLQLLLSDALAIEGSGYEVLPWTDGQLRLVGHGERYEIRVVKKRG